ncbi:MAG: hypothetical protein F6K08_16855 [Okeania sp. SIO1H6]|nr:hypothetical protein [Okeania sp. SIO1H6]
MSIIYQFANSFVLGLSFFSLLSYLVKLDTQLMLPMGVGAIVLIVGALTPMKIDNAPVIRVVCLSFICCLILGASIQWIAF